MFTVHISPLSLLKTVLDVVGLGQPLWTNITCYKSPLVTPLSIGSPRFHKICLVLFSLVFLIFLHMALLDSLITWNVAMWITLVLLGKDGATWLAISGWGIALLCSLNKLDTWQLLIGSCHFNDPLGHLLIVQYLACPLHFLKFSLLTFLPPFVLHASFRSILPSLVFFV